MLAHAHIGAALQAHELAAEVPLRIDLSAARAYTLDDVKNGDTSSFPAGWGGPRRIGWQVPQLDLDGFVYERIEHFPTERGRLRQWLSRLLRRIGAILAPLGRLLARLLAPVRETPPARAAARVWNWLRDWASGREDIAGPRLDWLRRQHVPHRGDFFPAAVPASGDRAARPGPYAGRPSGGDRRTARHALRVLVASPALFLRQMLRLRPVAAARYRHARP